MWDQLKSSLSFFPLGALDHESYPRVDPTKRQGTCISDPIRQSAIDYRLLPFLTLGEGGRFDHLLGEVAEGSFQRKEHICELSSQWLVGGNTGSVNGFWVGQCRLICNGNMSSFLLKLLLWPSRVASVEEEKAILESTINGFIDKELLLAMILVWLRSVLKPCLEQFISGILIYWLKYFILFKKR